MWAEAKLELLKRIWVETPLKLELDEIVVTLSDWYSKWPENNKAKILLVEAQIVRSIFWDQPIPASVNVQAIIATVNDEQLLTSWVLRNFWVLWKVPPQIFPEIFKLVSQITHILAELKYFCGLMLKLLLPQQTKINQQLESKENLPVSDFVNEYCKINVSSDSLSVSSQNEQIMYQFALAIIKGGCNFEPRDVCGIKQYHWEWKSKRQWIWYDIDIATQLEHSFSTKKKRISPTTPTGNHEPPLCTTRVCS